MRITVLLVKKSSPIFYISNQIRSTVFLIVPNFISHQNVSRGLKNFQNVHGKVLNYYTKGIDTFCHDYGT